MRDQKGLENLDLRPSVKLNRYVADALRQRLIKEELAGGTKLPSLRTMADEFGVSTMTIRQAISILEKEGHLHRVSAAGTYVGPASHANKSALQMVALATVHMGSAFETEIAHGVEKACQARGFAVQILDAHATARLESRNLLRLPSSSSRGAIILHTCDPRNVQALKNLQRMSFPFVMVDRCPPGLNVDFVESDHEQGAYVATKYLLEHGHRQLVMLIAPPLVSSLTARIRGYERALADAGVAMRPDGKVFADPKRLHVGVKQKRNWLGGYEAIMPVLEERQRPSAVFASDHTAGWGVYQACRELNLRIPGDVSVIAFDDTVVSRALVPPMTAIAQRTDEIARRAVELLEQRLEQGDAESGHVQSYVHSVVDVELIERQSVAARSASPPGVD